MDIEKVEYAFKSCLRRHSRTGKDLFTDSQVNILAKAIGEAFKEYEELKEHKE